MIGSFVSKEVISAAQIVAALDGRGERSCGEYTFASITYSLRGMKPKQEFQLTYAKIDWAANEVAIRLYINLWGSFANSFRFEYVEEPTVFDFRVTCERDPDFDIMLYIEERDIRKAKIVDASKAKQLKGAFKDFKKDEERVIQVSDQVLETLSKKSGLIKRLKKLHIRMILSEKSLYLWVREKKKAEKEEEFYDAKLTKVNEFSKEGQMIRATPRNIFEELVRTFFEAR